MPPLIRARDNPEKSNSNADSNSISEHLKRKRGQKADS